MLDNIRFCYCARLDLDEERANQCMFFGFTKRAQKALSEEFLFEITDTGADENLQKTGIPLLKKDIQNGDRVFINKLEDNQYRIKTRYVESLVRCLFNFIPSFYVDPKEHPPENFCDLTDKDKEI